MALITCPECGAQVSDAAPACPKCGYPVATAVAAADGGAIISATTAAPSNAEPQPEPEPLPTERSAEPFTLGGRRIPIAAILFWGGLVVGMVLKAVAGEDGETPFRALPYVMILAGVLWFSVTELMLLIRHRKRRY
jgi:uncharacterized OB-fold protein